MAYWHFCLADMHSLLLSHFVPQGPVSDFVTCCEVERMREPLILSISADVEGLGVTFETPKMFDVER